MRSVLNLPALVVATLLFGGTVAAQPVVSPPPTFPVKDVLVVALGAKKPSEDSRLAHLARRFLGLDSEADSMLDMQMRLVAASAAFGPVFLISADDAMKAEIWTNCSLYAVCDQLRNGSVRLATVPHGGPWIRDYGPSVTVDGASVKAVRGRYFRSHIAESYEKSRADLNIQRMKLIHEALNGDNDIVGLLKTEAEDSSRLPDILMQLSLLEQLADVMRDPATQSIERRDADDQAAFGLMSALLTKPAFSLTQSELDIDGGNLMQLEDGRCLTTKALFGENPGQESKLDPELRTLFGCKDVIYLDPLPGPGVIPHVDMFVLPVGGNRLLLGTYNLAILQSTPEWKALPRRIQSVVLDAAEDLNRNERVLRGRGFDVTLVPLLLPIESDSIQRGSIFYPTNLNATVRSNGRDRIQVLLPVYEGVQHVAQKAALAIIRGAFGAAAEFVEIESTSAAKGQGAVHCLTITVPEAPTLFGDLVESQQHALAAALRIAIESQETKATPETLDLTGQWLVYDDEMDAMLDPDDAPATATFDGSGVKLKLKAGGEISGRYTLEKAGRASWNLRIEFPASNSRPARTLRARAEWQDEGDLRLTVGGDPVTLRRKEISAADRIETYQLELEDALDNADTDRGRKALQAAIKELSDLTAEDRATAIGEMLSFDLLKEWPVEILAVLQSAPDLGGIQLTATGWNEICWSGSLLGSESARKVSAACEAAVKIDPDPDFLDSRAVNRALIGDYPGAVSDFRVFVSAEKDKEKVAQRQRYIDALLKGINPLTPEELRLLAGDFRP